MVRIALLTLTLGLLFSCSAPSAERDSTARTAPTVTSEAATNSETTPSRTVSSTRGVTEPSGPETTSAAVEALPSPDGATRSESSAASPAVGKNGMVSTANPLATEAGLEVLADGGNAYDASVTVAATLGVVEPMMNGIGGYGATVIYDAGSGETRYLGASSRVPQSLDLSVFYPPTPEYIENRSGAASISTPGAVNDWEALWEEYGSLEWDRLL